MLKYREKPGDFHEVVCIKEEMSEKISMTKAI